MKAKIKYATSNLMLWLFPLLLIVPNVLISCTSGAPLIYGIANVLFPLGCYFVALTLTRRTALAILLCLPLMLLNAFQIVLIYLYGSGIIAIDMFLNVVTTSVGEASELLDSLLVSIGFILVLYLPPLIWAVRSLIKGKRSGKLPIRHFRQAGFAIGGLGLIALVMCYVGYAAYDAKRDLYPLNVVCNMAHAVERTHLTENYQATSAKFSYHAKPTHDPSEKEAYVLVIGETSRADNWEIMGYDRPTNPLLSKRTDIVTYPKAMSESNTTHKSVPMILTHLDSRNFGDSIYASKSVITAFDEAGFKTAFFSCQGHNHSFIDFFGEQADTHDFLVDDGVPQLDAMLVAKLKEYIDTCQSQKLMIVLHSYGSHFNYRDRYPEEMAYFQPTDYANAGASNRPELINAYDNSIRYTDYFLNSVIDVLQDTGYSSAMLYLSDHGEDIYDDHRERFLHASPTPTYYQLHVPMVLWTSEEYTKAHPDKVAAAHANTWQSVTSQRSAFHTLLDLAGLDSPYFDIQASLASEKYKPVERIYINDYNEGVALENSGIKNDDRAKIAQMEGVNGPSDPLKIHISQIEPIKGNL